MVEGTGKENLQRETGGNLTIVEEYLCVFSAARDEGTGPPESGARVASSLFTGDREP